jgi:hypothetical protein
MKISSGTLGGGDLYSVLCQLYRKFIREFKQTESRVEVGSNISTVGLRVIEGDEKEDSKIWSRVPRESDPRMTALLRASSNCK